MLALLFAAILLAQDPPGTPLWNSAADAAPVIAEIAWEGADPGAAKAAVPLQPGAPLDVRDVRDAVRALHASARFSRVAAYVEVMSPGKVRLVFVLSPVHKLVEVRFTGRKSVADGVLQQAANLQVNAEYQDDAVAAAAEAIRAVYFRLGYRHTRVQPVPKPVAAGVALELRIDEGPATRIAEVRFEGESGLDHDELRAAFKLESGDVLSVAALDESIRGLRERYRKSGHLRARVDAPRVEELEGARARVVVPVDAGPYVRFHLRGNRAFPDSVLSAQLGMDSDQPLDAQSAQEMAARLRRFYVAAGFYRARVAEREMRARDGSIELVFSIHEGEPVRVDEIRFSGNRAVPTGQLRERLLVLLRENLSRDPVPGTDAGALERTGLTGIPRYPRPARTKIDPDTVFDPVVYARALKQFEDLYKSMGYLSVRAGPPKIEPLAADGSVVRIAIPLQEGERTLVGRVLIEGGGDVPPADLDAAVGLRPGSPFSYLAAEEGRTALAQVFMRRGHLYARVEDEEAFEDAPEGATVARVDVRYRIQPGPIVRVSLVEVVGHRRTLEGLVLDLVGLKPGDVLTPEVIDKGQQALLRTGLFFSATLTPRNPDVAEPEKTLQVQLRERPSRDFQASIGFSLADGPRTTAQWTQSNLFGRNLTFSAVAKADFPFTRFRSAPVCPPNAVDLSQCSTSIVLPPDPVERVIDLGLLAPRLYPLTDAFRAGLDLIHERALRPAYDLTKYSAQLSLELNKRRPFLVGVAYEFGYQGLTLRDRSIEDVIAGRDRGIFRLPSGEMLFGSLRPLAALDLRDDPARPRSGLLLQVSGDYLRSYTGTQADQGGDQGPQKIHVNLFKVQGLLAGYLPLPYLSSLVLSARGGRVYQLDARSQTPGDRRFYLGGATSLRGFHEDALQPQDLIQVYHLQVRACEQAIAPGFACTPQALLLEAGGTSDGGDVFVAMGAELRLPVAASAELAIFYDAGNLWVSPKAVARNFVLRDAVGFGFRWLTPIGRVAVDIGFNLQPDPLLGEPRWGPYFALDPL